MERHFLLFKDQLEESGRQKQKKENIIPRGKFRQVENSLYGAQISGTEASVNYTFNIF